MNKKLIISALTIFSLMNLSYANTVVTEIQSPIYKDEIGRSHFLGKGGYSSVRRIDMGNSYSSAINEVANDSRHINRQEQVTTNVNSAIKQREDMPTTTKAKATFTSQQRTMDASASFGNGATYLPDTGLNKSKTLYTDDIGRLHFFGKGNLIKE